MNKVSQGQKEGIHKNRRGHKLDALLLSTKGKGHNDGLHWDI